MQYINHSALKIMQIPESGCKVLFGNQTQNRGEREQYLQVDTETGTETQY